MPRKLFDISVPVKNGGVVYPGNPEIHIELQQDMSRGGSSNVSLLSIGSHTATHVDAPLHMIPGGAGVDRIPLDALVGPALVIAFDDDVMAVTEAYLRSQPIAGHERVLLKTRNSHYIRERDFHRDYTYLAPDGAEYLVSLGVRLVGIDYLSIEQFHSGHHRTHKTLLSRGVVIVEGLDLSEPPAGEYELCCLPLLLEGVDGAPARAVLMG
ncbi:MAG TPA: cyclase family protein [Gemmatimonadaceae bacterium]|nr:cyclase family protein [Gemmatimonadaceae bacterium]